MKKAFLILTFFLILAACSPSPVEVPVTVISKVTREVSVTVEIPVTVIAEATREVTKEVEITRIVERVVTPTIPPTSTPSPTPEITLENITLSGTGDSIVDIQKPDDPAIVHITGNASGRFFSVKSLDQNNETIDLLVNTTDPYDGVRPLDFFNNEHTHRFEVTATGDWAIEVRPVNTAHIILSPGTYNGTGDDVLILTSPADTATISGNETSRFFSVSAYGSNRELLVNTTDPYEGTVLMPNDAALLEIQAEGDWRIELD